MERKEKLSIEKVFVAYEKTVTEEGMHYGTYRNTVQGDEVKLSSHRIWTFYENGLICKGCGLKADYFVKQRHENDERWHLALYAVNEEEQEVEMTKDHITPSSLGGDDHISNYQTMCRPCNEEKGNCIK